jgi:hypothetical protein
MPETTTWTDIHRLLDQTRAELARMENHGARELPPERYLTCFQHLYDLQNLLPPRRATTPPEHDAMRAAAAWEAGAPNPDGTTTPLSEAQREWLKKLCRLTAPLGLLWHPAVERAATRQDGLNLREILNTLAPPEPKP